MTVRVDVSPSVLNWALDVAAADSDDLRRRFKIEEWLSHAVRPTLKQLQDFARATGVPFGYLLLPEPPRWRLPMPDFREGFAGTPTPSANLIAVIGQSQRRQEWYRDYAVALGAENLEFVGSAEGVAPVEAGIRIRAALDFEVDERTGTWNETRKTLLRSFEKLGGLTVASSIVDNNTHRRLDEQEFRGFALVDKIAPLVFVNQSDPERPAVHPGPRVRPRLARNQWDRQRGPATRRTVRSRAVVQRGRLRGPGSAQ